MLVMALNKTKKYNGGMNKIHEEDHSSLKLTNNDLERMCNQS